MDAFFSNIQSFRGNTAGPHQPSANEQLYRRNTICSAGLLKPVTGVGRTWNLSLFPLLNLSETCRRMDPQNATLTRVHCWRDFLTCTRSTKCNESSLCLTMISHQVPRYSAGYYLKIIKSSGRGSSFYLADPGQFEARDLS